MLLAAFRQECFKMNVSRRSLLSASAALVVTPVKAFAADQTLQVQTAINKAISGDGFLRLAAGKYHVTGLQVNASLQIEGVAGKTILVGSVGVSIMNADNAKRLIITGVTFEGGDNGLSLTQCGGKISNCEFRSQAKTALLALDSKGVEISGNHVHDVGNNGIQVWTSDKREDGTIITNNRVERIAATDGGSGQYGNGINIYKAGNVLVSNNRITDCAYSAIRNNSGSNCQITSNSISRTEEVAIYVEFSFEGAVINNNMIDDVCFGISITNFKEGGRLAVCNGNLVRNVRNGITNGVTTAGGIYAEADTLLSNNVVENAKDFGIGLGWGPYARNLSALGNMIKDCDTGLRTSVTEGAGVSYIANNTIIGSRLAAITGMDHLDPMTDDLGKPDAKVPDVVLLKDNVIRA
jgi:uncharacterized secreted repeat protein (TIGR03808 family)